MRVLVSVLAVLLAACSSTPAAPLATIAPTPFVVPTPGTTPSPQRGSGVVTFGAAGSLEDDTLAINPRKDTFKVSVRKIAWSAAMVEPAGTTRLTLIIAKLGSGGTEGIRYTEKFDFSNPAHDIVAATSDLAALVNRKPGTYVLRILRGGTVLAEGKFKLVN